MQATLNTRRLVLRPRELADTDACLRMDLEPEVTRYVSGPWSDPVAHRAFIEQRTRGPYLRGLGYWTLRLGDRTRLSSSDGCCPSPWMQSDRRSRSGGGCGQRSGAAAMRPKPQIPFYGMDSLTSGLTNWWPTSIRRISHRSASPRGSACDTEKRKRSKTGLWCDMPLPVPRLRRPRGKADPSASDDPARRTVTPPTNGKEKPQARPGDEMRAWGSGRRCHSPPPHSVFRRDRSGRAAVD